MSAFNIYLGPGIPTEVLPDAVFNDYMSRFLFSPEGAKWMPNFNFLNETVVCGEPTSQILVLKHHSLE